MLNRTLLDETLSRGKDSTLNEDAWDKEFYRVLANNLTCACHISSQAGQSFSDEQSKRKEEALDFYIDGKLQWMIEFIVEGRRLVEHVERFDRAKGRYKKIPMKDWLIVDMRKKKVEEKTMKKNVMYVIYGDDLTEATVKQVNKKDVIIRHK